MIAIVGYHYHPAYGVTHDHDDSERDHEHSVPSPTFPSGPAPIGPALDLYPPYGKRAGRPLLWKR
jgi:hypothetical protein